MPVAHHINREFGHVEIQKWPKEPKYCGEHPERKAIWQCRGVGYCSQCRERAYAAAAGTVYAMRAKRGEIDAREPSQKNSGATPTEEIFSETR